MSSSGSTVLQWYELRSRLQSDANSCCLATPVGLATLELHDQWVDAYGVSAARQLWELVLKSISNKAAAKKAVAQAVPPAPMAEINRRAGA